jgi:hypothetical protein
VHNILENKHVPAELLTLTKIEYLQHQSNLVVFMFKVKSNIVYISKEWLYKKGVHATLCHIHNDITQKDDYP